jgi:hypothetical protein
MIYTMIENNIQVKEEKKKNSKKINMHMKKNSLVYSKFLHQCWITERGGESVIEQFNHIIQVLYQ